MEKQTGYDVGDTCNRDNCIGFIVSDVDEDQGCSCHINPPCSKCTSGVHCDECGWSSDDEYNTNIVSTTPSYVFKYETWEELCSDVNNNHKIISDIISRSGAWKVYKIRYPLNITLDEVLNHLGYNDKYCMPRFKHHRTDNIFNYTELSVCLD